MLPEEFVMPPDNSMGVPGMVTPPESIVMDVIEPDDRELLSVKKIKTRKPLRELYKITLTKEQEEALSNKIREDIDDWESNVGTLVANLKRWNNLLEGIVPVKTFPWELCSNLHIPIVALYSGIVHSIMRKTLLDVDPIFFYHSLEESEQKYEVDIENLLQWVFTVDPNLIPQINDLLDCTIRDGVAVAQVDWYDEIDTFWEAEEYEDVNEFTTKYPTPESLSVSYDQYNAYLKELYDNKYLALLIEARKDTYNGPRINIVDLNNFVLLPPVAADLTQAQAKGFGQRLWWRLDYLLQKEKQGFYYNITDKVAKSSPMSSKDSLTVSKNDIEGISNSGEGQKYFKGYELVYRYDLNNDGIEERYLVSYSYDAKAVIRIERYPFLKSCYIPFYIKKRPQRFLGIGFPYMLQDLNDEINTQHNQRIDSRSITNVPSFKALESARNKFNPDRKDMRFRPGVVFWLDRMQDVEQFQIRPTDMGESIQEENNLMRFGELYTGATQLSGGREVSFDPRSSGKKVQTLLGQSSMRIDDYIFNFSMGLVELANFILSLYYQFGTNEIDFGKKDTNGQREVLSNKQIAKKVLKSNKGYVKVNCQSVMQNSDMQLQKQMAMYQTFMKSGDPIIIGDDQQRYEMISSILSLAQISNRFKILKSWEDTKARLEQQKIAAMQQTQQPQVLPGNAMQSRIQQMMVNRGGAGNMQ